MPITQPTYPITTSSLVSYLGGYADQQAGGAIGVSSPTTAKLQAALDYAGANGIGYVKFSQSFDTTATIYIPNNVTLDGGGATIRQANGANLAVILATEGWDSLVGTMTTVSKFRHFIYNLRIDGNYENNLTAHTLGLGVYSLGFQLDLVTIHHCRGIGLWTENGPPVDPTKSPLNDREPATEGFMDRIRVSDNIDGGFYYNGPNDPIINRVFGVRNGHGGTPASPTGSPATVSGTNPGTGWNVKFGPNAVAPICNDWHLWGNSLWHLYMGDAQGGEFTACQIEGGGNTAGQGGCVYYNAPGAHFVGGRIFTGTVAAGWIDSAKGIVFGPQGWNLKMFGTVIDNCRPAFDFTNGGGANSYLRCRWSSPDGSMISGTPDPSILWDVEDLSYGGDLNLPQNSRRVMYGYSGPKGGGKVIQRGSHTFDSDDIDATVELTGSTPVVSLGAPDVKTIPLGSRARFVNKSSDDASFAAAAGGAQQYGKTNIVGTFHNPTVDGQMTFLKITPGSSGAVVTTAALLTVVNAGTESMRMAAYTDASGRPGTLLGSSNTRTVVAADVGGTFGTAYVPFTWGTPLNVTNGSAIWLALHAGSTAGVARPAYSFVSGQTGVGWMIDSGQTFASGAPANVSALGADVQGPFYMNISVPANVTIASRGGLLNLPTGASAEVYRGAFASWTLTGEIGSKLIVEMTQAEYDALTPKDPNTLYVITG